MKEQWSWEKAVEKVKENFKQKDEVRRGLGNGLHWPR
jgi:hypothetical protein